MTRSYFTFSADFGDDTEEDEEGHILVPAGRIVATAISRRVNAAGIPVQHSFYGWRFEFPCPSGKMATVLLQHPDPWLLIVKADTRWFHGKRKREAALCEAVDVVERALGEIAEITGIRRFSKSEYEAGKDTHD